MFTKDQDAIYQPSNLFIWFLLAFQGGLLNIGGYLAVHRFVSHITGYATLFGVKGLLGDWGNALGMLIVPFFYLLGVMVSAWFIERRRLKNIVPKYSLVFGFIILNLVLISLGGVSGQFGAFGETFNYSRDYILLFLLVYTCGLQNAVISSASGYVIRTTHLTGLTTDFGIGIIRLWTTRAQIEKKEIFVFWCRAGIILSFTIGSLLGAFIFHWIEFYGFLIPLAVSLFVAYRLQVVKITRSL